MTDRRAMLGTFVYAIVAAIIVVIIVVIGLPSVVAAIVLAPLVLFAPGYALVVALGIPRLSDSPGRRLIFGIVLSMACVIFGGLVLNAITRLTTASWTVLLVTVTCLASLVALFRIRRREPGEGDEPSRLSTVSRAQWFSPRLWCYALAVVVALAGAVVVTEVSSRHYYNQPVTQLTLLPSGSDGDAVTISVVNHSGRAQRFDLVVQQSGVTADTTTELSVGPSGTWTRREAVGTSRLTASLRRIGATGPFAQVVWTPSPGSSS
jgi:uncharacterized membrane protein